MAAAAMAHLLPNIIHPTVNQSPGRGSVTAYDCSRADAQQHDAERNDVIHWSQGNGALRPEEIAKDPDEKCIGHSARHLACDDFEFIRTLGTGMLTFQGRSCSESAK